MQLPQDSTLYAVAGRKGRKAYGFRFYLCVGKALVNVTADIAPVLGLSLSRKEKSGRKALLDDPEDLEPIVQEASKRLFGNEKALNVVLL